jgi:hypothetical protein
MEEINVGGEAGVNLNAAPESKAQFNSEMLRNWIEPFSKIAVMVTVVCYAAGFIVVNSYLSTYGYYLLDFFRVGYISAGVLAIGFALFPNIIFWAIVGIIRTFRKKETPLFNNLRIIAFQFVPGVSLTSLLIIVAFSTMQSYLRILVGFLWLLIILNWVYDNFRLEASSRQFALKNLELNIMMWLFIFISYFPSFGQYVYGLIPVNFGGGKPTSVLIVSDIDSRPYLELAGIKLFTTDKFQYIDTTFKNKVISEPVGLLAESEQSYTVIVKQNDTLKAVTFDKKFAKAIIHGSSVIIGSLKK